MEIDRLSIIEDLETFMPQDRPSIDFDLIFPPCNILNVLTMQDIMDMNQICKNRALGGRPKEKQNLIKQIMTNRGFKKLAAGTNRLVFKYMEDQSFVIKVPFNAVGLRDNLDELYNQNFLKPFCTKVFEVSPCGTVGMFERVHGITNREEFKLLSPTIFEIIINKFIGQFVLADFGTKFFMNWGIRKNAYPVLLDFPYLYELDGAKLYCNRPEPLSEHGFCGGEIDYDNGFNRLVCKECGKTYLASELRLSENKKNQSILIEREDIGMIVTIRRGDKIEYQVDTTKESDTYRKGGRTKETPLEYRERKACEGMKVEVTNEPQQSKPLSEEDLNHGYDLSSIPTDINDVYKGKVTVSRAERRRREKENRKNNKKNKNHNNQQQQQQKPVENTQVPVQEEKQETTNPVPLTVEQPAINVPVADPISREVYDQATQEQFTQKEENTTTDYYTKKEEVRTEIQNEYDNKVERLEQFYDHTTASYINSINNQYREEEPQPQEEPQPEESPVEEETVATEPQEENKEEEVIPVPPQENCGTNMGDLLQNAIGDTKLESDEQDSFRPANAELEIELEKEDKPEPGTIPAREIPDMGHIDSAFYD